MNGLGGWPLLWVVVALVALGLLVYVAATQRRTNPDNERDGAADDALSTLRARYARGEISDEEFEERRIRLEEWE
ncbi:MULTISPECIES: SHOCT domain-containing protein [Halostella]|uniref:SHOCT domain-containing protein n=1 Tax=Halostella TaxID=1843185 RepID=UPI001F03D0D4|nr:MULTISPECIES: SHOCT domain-containing protein [Halostella]